MSYSAINEAEWRTRKINVFALLRSFVGQLKIGQELTKVSLPSVLCFPFSMLELVSQREMLTYHVLFEINQKEDPLERFMIVLKWYLSLVRAETMEKKPFNPVIGETHVCWVNEHDEGDDDVSVTEFIAEQVSHHPPVTAFIARNKAEGLDLTSNISFGVKFGGNKAAVTTAGTALLTTGQPRRLTLGKETYELSKIMPDLMLNNVVKGKRWMVWSGEVYFESPETGYKCVVRAFDKDKKNYVDGRVWDVNDPDTTIYEFHGLCGGVTEYWDPDEPNDKKVLLDTSQIDESTINYLPPSYRTPMSSLEIWKPVNKAIILDDMSTADTEKKKIEAAQRIREAKKKADGLANVGTYFFKDTESLDTSWVFNKKIDVMTWLKIGTTEEIEGSLLPDEVEGAPEMKEKKKKKEEKEKKKKGKEKEKAAVTTSTKLPKEHNSGVDEVVEEIKSETEELASGDHVAVHSELGSSDPVSSDPFSSEPVSSDEMRLRHSPSPKRKHDVSSSSPRKQQSRRSDGVTAVKSSGSQRLSPATLVNGKTSRGRPLSTSSASRSGSKRSKSPRRDGKARTGSSAPELANSEESEDIATLLSSGESKREIRRVRKEMKKELRKEKKELTAKAKEHKKMFHTSGLLDNESIVYQGVLKLRNSLKKWHDRWVVLVPGSLIYFKNKADMVKENCAGMVALKGCYVKPRPSKKDGFCLKIFNIYNYPIFSRQDLRGKTLRKGLRPASTNYCLLRATDTELGRKWIKMIASAIPDYDRSKTLVSDSGTHTYDVEESESEVEEDEEESDELELSDEMEVGNEGNGVQTPPSQNTTASPTSTGTKKIGAVSEKRLVKTSRRASLGSSVPSRGNSSRVAQPTTTRRSDSSLSSVKESRGAIPRLEESLVRLEETLSRELRAMQEEMLNLHSLVEKNGGKSGSTQANSGGISSKSLDSKISKLESRLAYVIRSHRMKLAQKEDASDSGAHSSSLKSKFNKPSVILYFLLFIIFYFVWSISSTVSNLALSSPQACELPFHQDEPVVHQENL